MSYYRIYRPKVIDEIDNVAVRQQLLNLLNKEKKDLPHAYLLTGIRGAGKTTTARLIAKIYNCEKISKKNGPCGECESCKSIEKGTNLDVLEIDAASNRGIDEVRLLRERIGLAPSHSPYSVYIIDEVHMMTTEAFNALLKTLEEPPTHVVFVLATTDIQKVPTTIKSRCLLIPFTRASHAELMIALKRIVEREKLNIDNDSLILLAESADGSFRDAVKLLEQASLTDKKITAPDIQTMLSLSDTDTINFFLDAVSDKHLAEALKLLKKISDSGTDIKVFLSECMKNLEVQIVASALGKTPTKKWNTITASDFLHRLTKAYGELKVSPLPEIPLTLAVIDHINFFRTTDLDVSKPKEKLAEPVLPASTNGPKSITDINIAEDDSLGLISLSKLHDHWPDIIEELKTFNHSIAGMLRSTKPKSVTGGTVCIEAFYKFHQEKLSEVKTREILSQVFKKLFGEKVKVEIVLGKK
jgi:DNA polymerase III subunit gamma/tau